MQKVCHFSLYVVTPTGKHITTSRKILYYLKSLDFKLGSVTIWCFELFPFKTEMSVVIDWMYFFKIHVLIFFLKSLSRVQLFVTPWTIRPWNSPGQNTGVGRLSLLWGIIFWYLIPNKMIFGGRTSGKWLGHESRAFMNEISTHIKEIKHLSSWAISNPKRWCCESAALNMSANLENSAVATGLEKVSFHSNPKERQCQRRLKLLHNCTHLTC